MPNISIKPNSSATWRATAKVWSNVCNNVSWIIKEGNKTTFWKDRWISSYDNLVERFGLIIS